jgi:hypothetical protein
MGVYIKLNRLIQLANGFTKKRDGQVVGQTILPASRLITGVGTI